MHYRLSADRLAAHYIAVEARLTDIGTPTVELQLPAWRPGRYELQHFAKNIQRFAVVDGAGQPLSFRKQTKERWVVQTAGASELTVRYNYYALLPTPNQLNAGSSFVSDTLLYVNPVNLCLYAEGRINEPCTLELAIPDGWMVAGGLTRIDAKTWRAADFYELVDGPLLAAPVMQHIQYQVRDTCFHVWIQGGRRTDGDPTFDAERLVRDFSRFSRQQIDLFGASPEPDYHFMTLILPVAHYHGVEHRNSTVLVLGPNDEGEGLYQDLLGVSSHELFHAWNIIRIRPVELLPYDFTQENYFSTCFVAEGVTTYYGDLILRQAGVFDDAAYLKELQVLFKRHFENNGRAFQSLADSSWDLWLDGYEKGVPDRKVSVYHKGAVVALMLDLHIRRLTNHARSLDDVMRTMWERFGRPFVGYTLDDYRAVTEAVAGESLAWYYDLCIFGNQPLETKLNEYLAWVGLQLVYEEPTAPAGRYPAAGTGRFGRVAATGAVARQHTRQRTAAGTGLRQDHRQKCSGKMNTTAFSSTFKALSTKSTMKRPVLLILLWFGSLLVPTFAQPASQKSWMLGPFVKQNAVNPILSANPITTFDCPVRHETVRWEEKDVYNPTAVVRNNKVYLLYRAEDTVRRVGGTSRLGLAISSDGMHFSRMPKPVFYPNNDAMKTYEWEGGCEDPRVVESPNGVYVMTYTAYDGKLARLCVATSRNLTDWQKQGLAFGNFDNGKYRNAWSKSGAIVCKRVGNRMVAQRINGTYWMYWGDKPDLRLAVSTDLLHWTPLETESSEGPLRPVRRSGTGRSDTGTPGVAGGKPIPAAESRRGTHDVRLIEPGPYALLTPAGILLIYNGMNNAKTGDPNLPDGAYSGGQLLFDAHNPTRLLDRSDTYFIRPDQPYEIEGQVNQVVFLEGMVPFRGRWFLYYGTADSKIGVATAKQ